MIRAGSAWLSVLPFALCGWAAGPALAGCSAGGPAVHGQPSGGPSPVVVRDGAGRHTATVTVGQRLEVILDSTYWTVAGSSQPGVLHQDGATVAMARPSSCPTFPAGTGCVPVRTDFSALKPGNAVITATRLGCGEARECAPGQRNFTLTVTVRARQ
jgi:hypothetical protein